jgi:hypothetical protein
MPGRGSIARLMIATVLVGLDLGVVRSWIGSGPVKSGADRQLIDRRRSWPTKYLGEFGPTAALGLIGLAVGVLTRGWARRFCLGVVTTGLLTSTTIFLAPASFRHSANDRIIRPIEGFLPNSSTYASYPSSKTEWKLAFGEVMSLMMNDRPSHQWSGLSRCPILRTESQVVLGLLQMPFLLLGGIIAVYGWRWPSPRSGAGDGPQPTGSP